jgi:hypothetical protein
MTYNLFLDDIREPEHCLSYTHNQIYDALDWIVVRSYDEFIGCVESMGIPEVISFDHDLADEHYDPDLYGSETYNEVYDNFEFKTGYDCAKWFIDYIIDNNLQLPDTIMIHSMNPVGALNIKSLFDTYNKVMGKD